MHALGPKAEGEELKISGRLWWPPALAPSLRDSCATRPPRGILGTLSPLTFHSGEFQDAAFKEVADRGRAAGVGRLAPWPPHLASVLGWGPWPSCPDLSLSQALSPGPQDGGVSVSSSPMPLQPLPSPTGAGVSASPKQQPLPSLDTLRPHPPTPSLASSVALTTVFSPHPPAASWDSEEVSVCSGA